MGHPINDSIIELFESTNKSNYIILRLECSLILKFGQLEYRAFRTSIVVLSMRLSHTTPLYKAILQKSDRVQHPT